MSRANRLHGHVQSYTQGSSTRSTRSRRNTIQSLCFPSKSEARNTTPYQFRHRPPSSTALLNRRCQAQVMLGMQCQHLHSAFRASAGPSAPENARSPRSSFGTSNLTFAGESSVLWAFISLMYPPPVHAAAPFKSHHACVCWTCCVSLSVMTRRFFLSFNLRSRRVHLVQPNLQQAPRARFTISTACALSLRGHRALCCVSSSKRATSGSTQG